MMLVDTSAWIPFFRRKGLRSIKERIASCLELDQAVYTCPVRFELLCGASKRHEEELINDALGMCRHAPFEELHWIESARIERDLRRSGISVPRDDIFIAAVALAENIPLLCVDRHFDLIRNHARKALKVEQLG
jgi:predicted nucleic acid-binding protein